MYLSDDRLYTASSCILYVYLMSDLTNSIATYKVGIKDKWDECHSGIIADNHLYIGGNYEILQVFEISSSLLQPLKPLANIIIMD